MMNDEKEAVRNANRPKSEAELRREREAAALRANLLRRKRQARDRKAVQGGPSRGSDDA